MLPAWIPASWTVCCRWLGLAHLQIRRSWNHQRSYSHTQNHHVSHHSQHYYFRYVHSCCQQTKPFHSGVYSLPNEILRSKISPFPHLVSLSEEHIQWEHLVNNHQRPSSLPKLSHCWADQWTEFDDSKIVTTKHGYYNTLTGSRSYLATQLFTCDRMSYIYFRPALCFILMYNCGLTVRNKRICYVMLSTDTFTHTWIRIMFRGFALSHTTRTRSLIGSYSISAPAIFLWIQTATPDMPWVSRPKRLRDPFCISVPTFVKISQTVAEISRFLWFSRQRLPPSWIFKNSKF